MSACTVNSHNMMIDPCSGSAHLQHRAYLQLQARAGMRLGVGSSAPAFAAVGGVPGVICRDGLAGEGG